MFVRLWFLQGIDRQRFEVASASNRLRVIHEEGPRGRDPRPQRRRPRRQPHVDHGGARPRAAAQDDGRGTHGASSSTWPTRSPTSACRSRQNQIQKTLRRQAVLAPAERARSPTMSPRTSRSTCPSAPTEFPGVVVETPVGPHLPVRPVGLSPRRLRRRDQRQGVGRTGRRRPRRPRRPVPHDDHDPRRPRRRRTATRTTNSVTRSGRAVSSGPPRTTLRAVPGERTIEVNAQGDLVDVVSRTKPKAGDDVWLDHRHRRPGVRRAAARGQDRGPAGSDRQGRQAAGAHRRARS